MKQFKKAKVVMLSTNELSKIGNLATYQKRSLAKVIKEGINPIGSTVQFWNLYIISDDEIKEGDYFLADNRLNTTSNKGLPNWVLCKCTKVKNSWVYCNEIPDEGHNGDWCKKIIATTDESLNLPQPSQQFIQKYIEEYNKGNVITDVLVEYDVHKNSFIPLWIPKVNPKDNTITIKKVKDSYSREEVIGFGNKVKEYCKDGWKSDSLHRVFFEWDKWIEENL